MFKKLIAVGMIVGLCSVACADTVITLTIPTAKVAKVVTAMCSNKPRDWQGTDGQWAKQRLVHYVRDVVSHYDRELAMHTVIDDNGVIS